MAAAARKLTRKQISALSGTLNYGMYRHGQIRLELFDKPSQDLHNPCIWYGDLLKLAINHL